MCGIAGVIDFLGRPIEEKPLLAACAALRHRGPDDSGIRLEQGPRLSIGLGAVRLAVMDPTPAGHTEFELEQTLYRDLTAGQQSLIANALPEAIGALELGLAAAANIATPELMSFSDICSLSASRAYSDSEWFSGR